MLLLVKCYDNKMVKLPKGFLLEEQLHAANQQKKKIYNWNFFRPILSSSGRLEPLSGEDQMYYIEQEELKKETLGTLTVGI